MNWARSYSSRWRVFRVNRDTWADGEQLLNVDNVGITRTADGALLESGSISTTGLFEPDYYRVVLTAEQNGDQERIEIATLLFDITNGEYNRGSSTHSAQGYSVLFPASTSVLARGAFAPEGIDGAQYVYQLLTETINAPVLVEGSFTLNHHVVHEFGSTVLDAAWAVLNAGNFTMQIDGSGRVHILPMPTVSKLILSSANAQMLTPGISYDRKESEVPNRYLAILGEIQAIAVNDLSTSKVSTVARGYNVDVVDTEPIPVNGETLHAYATRKLHELSTVVDTRSYTREFAPGVNVYDLVNASLDGLDGLMRIKQQSLSCGYGVTVAEQAVREVDLWQ